MASIEEIKCGENYYIALLKLKDGEAVTLYKPHHVSGQTKCYVIGEVQKDLDKALGFTTPSYAVATRDYNHKLLKLDYYDPEKGKEFIRSVVYEGWAEQAPTTP